VVSDKVYLSTQNLNLQKSRTKFIGPYKVTDSHPEISRYTLYLPPELKAQRIVPSFHVSLLRLYHKSDDAVFPKHKVHTFYDFGNAEDNKWLVDDIITHKWEGNNISFLIQWNLGNTTWEPYIECKELTALDWYLELLGTNDGDWKKLPKKLPPKERVSRSPPIDTLKKRRSLKKT
jgi:hypothetical protein